MFGKYVKTVGICSARQTTIPRKIIHRDFAIDENDFYMFSNTYVNTKKFGRQMERIFGNIRSRVGSATIAVYDNPRVRDLFKHPSSTPNVLVPMNCFGWAQLYKSGPLNIGYRVVETLEETVHAAWRANCSIKCLRMDLFGIHHWTLGARLSKAMQKLLESTFAPLSLDLGNNESSRLSYCTNLQKVELRNVVVDGTRLEYGSALPLHTSYSRLRTQLVTQLKVSKAAFFTNACLRTLLIPHLRSLEFDTMSIPANFIDSSWSEYIRMISSLISLQHCRLSKLIYLLPISWADDNLLYMTIDGHGRYTCPGNQFDLMFRDGHDSIELHGDNVCEKIKELAYYAAAAETQKLQKIASDGRVVDLVIGITDKIQDQSTNEQTALS